MDQQLNTLKYFVLATWVTTESPEKKKNIFERKKNKKSKKENLFCAMW